MGIPPASHGKLLPNGHVMWQGKGPDSITDFVGSGSIIKEVDWDRNEVWRHEELGLVEGSKISHESSEGRGAV